MMIGDGINDSVALAGAAVGVAMGAGGSAMAAAAANIVLLSDNLARLPQTITLCRQVRQIILQNCVISIVTKIVAIGLAMAGLLQFWQAILLDVGTLLIVIANGVRPLATKVFVDKIEGNCIIGASADMGAGKRLYKMYLMLIGERKTRPRINVQSILLPRMISLTISLK
jgi:hypothetical protein